MNTIHAIAVTGSLLFNLLGVVWSLRAVNHETRAKNLTPIWKRDLLRAKARLLKERVDGTIQVQIADAIMFSGLPATVILGPPSGTIEERLTAIEDKVQRTVDMVSTNESKRLTDQRKLEGQIRDAKAAVLTKIEVTDQEVAKIDVQSLDLQLWAVLFVALGAAFTIIATIT